MQIEFSDNEFTCSDLLRYLRTCFGLQINGSPFTIHTINNWIRIGKIPMLYGDHRILRVEIFPKLNGLKVLTIEGMTRDLLVDLHLLEPKPFKPLPKTMRVRKHRTKLYYQILEKHGKQNTKKTLSMLPDSWKLMGIKYNQLTQNNHKKK